MSRLNKFCCCCTTRTGTLVIGTLGWILTLVQIFAGLDPRSTSQEETREMNYRGEYIDSDLNDKSIQNNIYFKIGCGLVALLVCILLVVGVYKKDKRYMLPWLVLKGLEATIVAILAVIVFFVACMHGVGLLFAIFFGVMLAAVLHWYFWLCVWSHYKELGEEPAPNVAAYLTPDTAPPQYMEKPYNIA